MISILADCTPESSRAATKGDLAQVSIGFSPVIRSICDKARELSIWRLRTRPDPIKVLANGRLALIGEVAAAFEGRNFADKRSRRCSTPDAAMYVDTPSRKALFTDGFTQSWAKEVLWQLKTREHLVY